MTIAPAAPTPRRRPALQLWSWGVVAAGTLYVVLTAPALPDPAPVAPASSTFEWWTTTPVEHALGGVARLVIIGVLAYLVLVAATQLLALAAPGTRLARAVDRLAPRALAFATAGVIVASSSPAWASPGPATTTDGGHDGVTMQVLTPSEPRPGSPAAEPRTSIPLAPTTTAPPAPVPSTDPAPIPSTEATPVPETDQSPSPSSTHRYVVQPGDHLWSIAERAVTLDGTTAEAAVVARYWRALIDANRDRLVDPADPDLILPGQELELPPLSAPRAR